MKNTTFPFVLFLVAFFSIQSNYLKAQSGCCPDFYLADAVEICPAEGACTMDNTDPLGLVLPPMAACKLSYHTYTVFPKDPTFSYTWTVTGGTITSTGNPCTVLWGNGNQGIITVTMNNYGVNGTCADTITEKICLIDGPQADFTMSHDTVCTGIPVSFYNASLGGSDFFWDFGDGDTYSGPTPPPHPYANPGTYTVTLIATDMGAGQWVYIPGTNIDTHVPCGCSDSITKTIVVLPGEGPIIDTDCCYGTVCPGDTSSFCTTMACGSYNWSATGGTIISGAGTSCITVQWNATYTGPTTVSLQSCPGNTCPGSTTLNVPVLYPNLPIGGPTTVCVGSSGSYSLPSLPGTYYNWTVSGGPYAFNQADRNVTLANITFFAYGTYWVKCEYNNPLAGCNGVDSIQVNVLPIFSISGPEKVCEGDTIYYTGSGPANWSISPLGPSILSGNGTSTISVLWTPGNYTILAQPSPSVFCNLNATKNVEVVAKPILNNILGPVTICKNKNHTFSISSNVSGSPFSWSVGGGTGTILSEMGADNDSVVIKFTGPGPWTVSVYQEIEISPGYFCSSIIKNLIVSPYGLPTITGQSPVCIDAVETYTATGAAGAGPFNWTIVPANRGTIQSGQGSNIVTIKWHGTPTTATLKVSNCSGSFSFPVVINGIPNAVASYNMTPIFCVGTVQTLILSTPTGVGYNYQWYMNGVMVATLGTNSSLLMSIDTFAIGTYQFHVVVTVNGCSAKSNTINVVIKDCPPPQGGGLCDVEARFWTYVVCDNITLINQSIVISPATIASYLWTLSGPGPGTFTPLNTINTSTAANPGLTVSVSGIYTLTLTVTSSTGCVSTIVQQFNVLLPTANFTFSSPVCVNQSAFFTAIPNNPNYNYFWTFGDGATSYDAITQHSYASALLSPYTVTLTITDSMGCVATRNVPITVNPIPNCTVSASDTTICPGDFAVLTTSCTGMSNYQWFYNGSAISGANFNTCNVYDYGEYWVTMTNSYGCGNVSDSVFIYLNQLPVANITGKGLQCVFAGGSSSFFLTTPLNVNYIYSWSSNAVGVSFSPLSGNNPYVSLTLPIFLPVTYEFIVNVNDTSTDCVKADTFCVTFYEIPTLGLPSLNACEGSSTPLTAYPNDTLHSYQWSNGATTASITASAVGYYGLTITDLLSGCTASGTAGFIHPLPDLSLFPTGCRTICNPDTFQLYIPLPLEVFWPNNTYPMAYPLITWYMDGNYGLPIGSGQFLNYIANNSGPHQINVVVQNSFGCSDTSVVFCLEDACCHIILEELISGNARCPEFPNGWFTITLDPASTGGPFTITSFPLVPPLPTTITPGVPLTVPNLAPGVYVITISNADGSCVEVYDIIIGTDEESCCFAEVDSSFTKIWSNTLYTSDVVWDGKYYIHDNVIVTVDAGAVLDITVVDVVFGECAGIVFQNGGRLRSSNSVYRPCEIDGNWKGLKFNGPGEFDNIVNESTFKNAQAALYFINGADAVISNNLFSNCNYGVRVESNFNFSHPISGNRFVTDDFFPDFDCDSVYAFVSNASTYGVYSSGSRFLREVSHNQFVNSKGNLTPRTYGIYQTMSGGVFSENTFTDMYNSVWLQSQMFYTDIENSEIESNIPIISGFPCIYLSTCQGPVIEINNNEFSNNYNKYLGYSAIYATSSSNVSIVNNQVDGFNFGILGVMVKNFQISSNEIRNSQTFGIYFNEENNSRSYITCNTIKMKNFMGTGLIAFNMAALSEVSSNCISDCRISMDFRNFVWIGGSTSLPKIRNNYLYNYSYAGINVQSLSGNIGTSGSPGMNTLYSNRNTAVDINSNTTIQVADNFGMFNISFPWVQITSNNPYHSTASCGHQIFNMPSQGNLNLSYVCDNFSKFSSPLTGTGNNFKLLETYHENLVSSSNPFAVANMILASLDVADVALLNDIINTTSLSENEKALIKYEFYYRHSDYQNARSFINLFVPATMDEDDYKTLCLFDLNIAENGWAILGDENISILNDIKDKESIHSNFAISLLNNTSTYRDHLVNEPLVKDIELGEDIRHIDHESYLNIYPNPTSGKVFIELISNDTTDNTLEIFDVSGKKVTEYAVNFVSGGFELDVHNLGEGFYFVTLTDATGFVQKGKLVKVNSQE